MGFGEFVYGGGGKVISYLKKEWMAFHRSGKTIVLAAAFGLFGIMNPATALLTPKLMELMADSLASSGMVVTTVSVNALSSWQQFFKNMPMALLILVLMLSSIYATEYRKGTLVIIITKGASRCKIAIAKYILLTAAWSVGFLLTFCLTYGYNTFYWDNSVAAHIGPAVFCYWLFGIFVMTLLQLFSTLFDSSSAILICIAAVIMVMYFASLFPKVAEWLPINLCGGYSLMTSAVSPADFTKSVVITLILIAVGFLTSLFCFRSKRL